MKNVILLANEFPYGTFEPYLESEINFYKDFEHVYLCSMQLRREHMKTRREVKLDNISFCDVIFAPKWVYVIYAICALFDKNFYLEMMKICKFADRKYFMRRVIKLFVFMSRSYYEFRKIKNFLLKEQKLTGREEGIIYSYRFEYQPYVALLLKRVLPGYKVVTRAHGFDLYEFRRKEKYIPMREYILKNVDKVFCISNHGKKYLSSKYQIFKEKIQVMKLGVEDQEYSLPLEYEHRHFRIVTCSTMIGIKRLDMLVRALAQIEYEMTWVHYGDGPEKDKIKNMCKELLPDNVKVCFKGHVDNRRLVEYEYRNQCYSVFLNVSSTEGIPVSIMEAFSHGIPVIATDVGGNGEIVKHEYNGLLIRKDFSCEELSGCITRFYRMDYTTCMEYREHARKTWAENFHAEKQYKGFIRMLNAL